MRVGFLQPALDLAELETNDLLQRLVPDGVVRDDHQAAEERGLEDLVQLRLQRLDQAFRGQAWFPDRRSVS